MNVSLTPELEQFVSSKVGSGRYNSASEVVREALRLLVQFDEARQREISDLNRKIEEGLAQAERGQLIDGEESRRSSHAVLARFSS